MTGDDETETETKAVTDRHQEYVTQGQSRTITIKPLSEVISSTNMAASETNYQLITN